jgi:FlaA1/EpsC-like NDP-sugar epimerase
VFIAMPSAPSNVIRGAVDQARDAGVAHIRILPPISELMSAKVETSQLRELNLEDLLGRSTVKIDSQAVETYLKGKVVLVSGASGSIGSQLCRQIAGFGPQTMLALDNNESGLFDLDVEIRKDFPDLLFEIIIGDVREPKKMDAIFAKFKPQVVFHAAAYKHVHLMEMFPEESVNVNVIGTKILADAALKHQAENFILISTDKAVNPPNVYGATKRLAETMIVLLNGRSEATRFSAVRFGNVLGSRGSVVPLFEEQIRHRGPVTITDPAMKRYFMVTSEALRLVLQASAMGEGGEVFVLDMGEPVMILDMAKELIRLHGFEPDKDIPIVFTGIRPGEKLFEDLLTAEEGTQATQHKRVFTARLSTLIADDHLWNALDAYQEGKIQGNASIVSWLKDLVPEFQPIEAQVKGSE